MAASSSGQPTPGRSSPRTVETRWTRPGCSSTAQQRRDGRPSPVAQTRPRSLRTRSTIITFSAWSLLEQVGRGAAGALDRARPRRRRPSRRRNSSGDAVATSTPWSGQPHDPLVRRRVSGGQQGGEADHVGAVGQAARTAPGRGWPGRPRRRRCARGPVAPQRCRRHGRATSSTPGSGTPGHGVSGRRRVTHVVEPGARDGPSKVTATAHQPDDSRAARSSVTSRRPVASRPPRWATR